MLPVDDVPAMPVEDRREPCERSPDVSMSLDRLSEYVTDRVRLSPNWSARPASVDRIVGVVIHGTGDGGNEEGALRHMRDPESRASAHIHFGRDGTSTRLVNDRRKAWHAGKSLWRVPLTGKWESDLNRITLGWELANRLDGEPYTDAQYKAVACAAVWYIRQGLTLDAFVGHEDIARHRTHNHRHDPGPAWSWGRFRREVADLLFPPPSDITVPVPDLDKAA